ncbi:lithostathine-like [Anolis sagrei]|uniref:lithostathine-like n=1 Tax=Anolis sagrei TaxID=38937 RepID=UPI003521C403
MKKDEDQMRPISSPWFCYMGLLVASLFFRWGACYRDIYQTDCNGVSNCYKQCPNGWVFYKDTCYGFFPDNVPWAEAEVRCFQHNYGHLVSILDKEEMKIVGKLVDSRNEDSDYIWIGLHDPQQNRRWRWIDQSISSYRAWGWNEPDNNGGNEFCVSLSSNRGFKYWNDADCSLEMAYVCKYPL